MGGNTYAFLILLWVSVPAWLYPVFSTSSLRSTSLRINASWAILPWPHPCLHIFRHLQIVHFWWPHSGFDYTLPSLTSLETHCESMVEVEGENKDPLANGNYLLEGMLVS